MNLALRRYLMLLAFPLVSTLFPLATAESAEAKAGEARAGIVLMHGKAGSPTKFVGDLASSLEGQGILVSNLEMPWSGRRDYDVDVGAAEKEVEAAISALREKGAQKVFVAGHSQGGVFALYFGGKHSVDGVIAIAPGGNVGSEVFRDKLGEAVATARKLVAEGKGDEKARLADYEGSRGAYPVNVAPSVYLTWFDPEGAMNEAVAVRNMNPANPVLFIAPVNDYPGLLKVKQKMFEALPKNQGTSLYEPESNHAGAPSASLNKIVEWMAAVAQPR